MVKDIAYIKDAIRLYYSNYDEVANYNFEKLSALNQPIARINAIHSSDIAKKSTPDEMSGLEPVIFPAKGAHVMLTMNLWTEAGLCNGASVSSDAFDGVHERQQLPLELAWAMTIHKSQGLTLTKAWIEIGKSEKTPGISYEAICRLRTLASCVIEHMTFERHLTSLKKSVGVQYRLQEESRLDKRAAVLCIFYHKKTLIYFSSLV
ncbi:PREDICTED: ATP-dependent DNA helicase PIF1-like [Acropora digitifera]|uniref:ATP-dependent DNA helicase PIF1-like n=1 Tax=Acropora digitifera TaxID=70779 RepID=UPI00077B24EA|nr:PREDICTED: ATP-dependent DNA helicase PIF1-like [Acropora digitifera]